MILFEKLCADVLNCGHCFGQQNTRKMCSFVIVDTAEECLIEGADKKIHLGQSLLH